ATHDLHVTWPVALDNDYSTWTAYSNQYWPAEYLIDKSGDIRHEHFGEGEYDQTERLIRRLLGAPSSTRASRVVDATPNAPVTPETYLGNDRLDPARYDSQPVRLNASQRYAFPSTLQQNSWAYDGSWTVGPQRAIAGPGARLRLHFHAHDVYIVL